MKFTRPAIGLPLLSKELVEQSSRRRTYIVRVVYAVLLFIASFFTFYDVLNNLQANQFGALGHGKSMFEFLVAIQFFGIYLFMPAIACGVLTAEKERNSLGLLFLTRLGPATILFEKLLSRLVPMFSFLLLSLPLLAFAYSLGGIITTYLWSSVWILAITTVQMGALAVMFSAFFRDTVGAFIGAYLLGLVMLFGLPVCEVLGLINVRMGYAPGGVLFGQVMEPQIPLFVEMLKAIGIVGDGREDILFVFFGPYIFYEHAASNVDFGTVVLRSIPILMSTVCFLVFARLFVVWRAFVPSCNYVLALFRTFDRLFVRMNQNRVTKGIVLVRESTALPTNAPVAWRETTKKSMGTVRYLFRMFVATEIPVVVVCILVVGSSYDSTRLAGVSAMLFFLWFIAVMLISVRATSLVSAERSHQTLGVLLTTPMSVREIVLQKYRGVRRLMFVLAVPFLTIFIFEATWKSEFWSGNYSYYGGYYGEFSTLLYLTASVLSIAIYFPMIAWLSFLVGMLVRSQSRAIITSLAIIVGWCALPICLLAFINEVLIGGFVNRDTFGFLYLLSPVSIIPFNEFNAYREIGDAPWVIVLINFVMYGTCLFVFRTLCLRLANRLLGRGGD